MLDASVPVPVRRRPEHSDISTCRRRESAGVEISRNPHCMTIYRMFREGYTKPSTDAP